jgi:hypothetical protein
MFRAMFSPIIRSTCLYSQYLVVFIQIAVGWCLRWVEIKYVYFNASKTPADSNLSEYYQILWIQSSVLDDLKRIQDTSRQQLGWILPDTVNTVKCLGWFETHPRHQPATTWVNTTRYCKYSQVSWMVWNASKTLADSYLGEYYQIL